MVFSITNATYPAVLAGHGLELYYIPYKYESVLALEGLWMNFGLDRALDLANQYWHLTIYLAIAYAIVIHVIQRAMVNREPFVLKTPLIIWNACLAVFSIVGFYRMSEEFIHVIRTRPLLDSIAYSIDPFQSSAFWGVCFALSKIFELGDTIFVVLRKKPLIFLHWYHHAVVLVYVFHAIKEGVAGARWFSFMNYGVHSLMYTYYTLAACGIRLPRKCAIILTTLQTTQMFIGVGITFIVFYYKLQGRIMQQSYENLSFCFAIYISFAYLFSDFFGNAYLKEKPAKTKSQ